MTLLGKMQPPLAPMSLLLLSNERAIWTGSSPGRDASNPADAKDENPGTFHEDYSDDIIGYACFVPESFNHSGPNPTGWIFSAAAAAFAVSTRRNR